MLKSARLLPELLVCAALLLAGAFGSPIAFAQSVPLLVQAEAMTLVSPMASGYDIAAMGGRFVSAASGTSGTNPQRNASVEVSVPAGTYYLWARIAGATSTSDALYVGIDSSFDRVFPSAFGPYQWVRVETSDASGAHAFSLTGTHTIQVGFGEIGAKLDAVYLTADANEVPAFTAPAKLLIEAEALNLTAPMTLGSEPAALGGQFISPTSGTTTTSPVREASIAVDVPAGTFYLWARIAGPTDTSDALYAGINSSFDRIFPSGVASGAYQWVRVETTDGSGAHGFVLAAGVHVIQVGHGEIGAKLDAVYLTSDAAEVPALAPMRRVIEAESFTLQSPMTLGVDAAASGAQYISPTSGTTSTTPVREAFNTVTAPVSGTYYLWARIGGPSGTSDALYVGFDSSFTRVFPLNAVPYDWVRVEAAPGVPGFSLTAGPHDIQVGHGEIGARLDAVYVTDDPGDAPPGGSTTPPQPTTAPCALPTGQYRYQGFGAGARGGLDTNGVPLRIVEVTNLDDTGAGSLREALSGGDRCIVFKLSAGGTINLNSKLSVRSNVTIDGFTAPAPGITLMNNQAPGPDENDDPPALDIASINKVTQTDIIVRGIRVRKAPGDGIRVLNASNVVIDRVSVTGYRDGAIDVTGERARNVTIQWSILGQGQNTDGTTSKINLNGHRAALVTVHHNLYINGDDRQPFCAYFDNATTIPQSPDPNPILDARNNLIWNHLRGASLQDGCTANLVLNYYHSSRTSTGNSIFTPAGDVLSLFISENVRGGSTENINSRNNRSSAWPLSLPAPTTTDARTAARAIIDRNPGAGAGARNLPAWDYDAMDDGFLRNIEKVGIQ